MSEGDFTIRAYRPDDRARVRYICHATGYMGDPAAWMWRDEESFADMFSGYYTDREPVSAMVGEMEGQVVGYLLGCVDTTAVWSSGAVLFHHGVGRLRLLSPGTAGLLWRMGFDVLRDALRYRQVISESFSDRRWPSHMHLDLLGEARGLGMGATLTRRWLEHLRSVGSPGCHVETLAENTRAVGFFRAMGFADHGPVQPAPGLRTREGGRLHLKTMVLGLS